MMISTWLDEQLVHLRDLEKAAEADRGHGNADFEHIPSEAYNAYSSAWSELRRWLRALEAPDGWIGVVRWCSEHDDVFGGAIEDRFILWEDRDRAVNQELLHLMHDRLVFRQVRPEDEARPAVRRDDRYHRLVHVGASHG
ncbi:MAG: hypothetical protein JRJ84_17680 [Deltaproteobacteria bacterium]|nr:hypothetical protein [Deltaproteobacteria bacterium]